MGFSEKSRSKMTPGRKGIALALLALLALPQEAGTAQEAKDIKLKEPDAISSIFDSVIAMRGKLSGLLENPLSTRKTGK